ncbi:MAG: hypothetical protein AB7I19_10780 [Planctomycetota bacterium]
MTASTRTVSFPTLARIGLALGLLFGCSGPNSGARDPADPRDLIPRVPVLEYLHVELKGMEGAAEAPRRVLVNGKEVGATGELIEFEGGRSVIALAGPSDYEPAEHLIVVDGTSALTPIEVVFRRR